MFYIFLLRKYSENSAVATGYLTEHQESFCCFGWGKKCKREEMGGLHLNFSK